MGRLAKILGLTLSLPALLAGALVLDWLRQPSLQPEVEPLPVEVGAAAEDLDAPTDR